MTVTAMAPTATPAAEEGTPKKSKKKLIIIVVGVLALVGGIYYMFLMPKPEKPPEPGEVVALEPIQINLGEEHYLRIGLALQLTTKAKEADGSKALDAAIALFSGLPVEEVNNPKHRKELKKELETELVELYEKEVMGVYFTEFVTQ
ncbi:MAG: flagellar basal body-associated FliL family protein [Propionibacteriales bacterium]|nr:flagellar basal body-associated FliL family protein [Propionibacteriales bacterium]